ncbi:MAG TPA: glycosyltransferase [Phycisphaerales bacterium]|nr:glycosyltransferase [Phycisphaerales bacterium]
MRICLVTSELAPFHGWGVGTANGELTRALLAAGHEVHLLVNDLPGLREGAQEWYPDAVVHVLDAGEVERQKHVPCLSTRRPMAVYERLKGLHAQHAFDYIGFNDFYADGYFAVSAKRTGAAFGGCVLGVVLRSSIFLLREINGQPEFDLEVGAIGHMERGAIAGADLVVSLSRAMVTRLSGDEELGPVFADGRAGGPVVRVIPNAVSMEDGERALRPRRKGASAGEGVPEVLCFGRLERRKGIETLVEAAQRLLTDGLQLRVRIVGVDTDTAPGRRSFVAFLKRMIEPRWRECFEFEDNQPHERLGALIARATVCCFPSLWENFPNVCLESMRLGAPVVGSDGGGMPEIIEDEVSGVIFRAGNAGSLGGALSRVLTDREFRDRIGRGAPERVRALCDPARVAAAWADAIEAARSSRAVKAGDQRASVSVVIPCFNMGATLPETVESVRKQTVPAQEIIVIDDGSTDSETVRVIAGLEREGVRVVRQHNQGLSMARNAGCAAAASEWVLPLDADDMLAPTFIERCLAAVREDAGLSAVTSCMACYTDASGGARDHVVDYVPLGFARDLLPARNVASSAIAMVRRSALEEVGGYDPEMTALEDWELWCRLCAAGRRLAVIPEKLIFNRIRRDSMLRSLGPSEHHTLRAVILEKHMGLSRRPDRVARVLLGETFYWRAELGREQAGAEERARERAMAMIGENARYRAVDRVNEMLKRMGVQGVIKRGLGVGNKRSG